MKINLQGKNIEVTNAIRKHVLKRLHNLEKVTSSFEKEGEVVVSFEVSRGTKHHQGEAIFNANCLITAKGQEFYSSADEADLYTAIDIVEENLFREINKNKNRKQTLFKRGASSVKKMLKGLSKRNPFTSKY